jgi:hypothetical protein
VSVRVWGATVAEEVHDLVNSLLVGGQVVPEHGGIFEVGLWVALLCVYEERELGRIAQEKDRCIVVYPVPIPLLSIEFDGETSRVTGSVWGTLLTTDCGEPSNGRSLLANAKKHVNGGDIANIMSNLKF